MSKTFTTNSISNPIHEGMKLKTQESVCVLGVVGDPYTRMICNAFKQNGISYSLLEVRGSQSGVGSSKWIARLYGIDKELRSGPFQTLSKLTWLPYKLLGRRYLFNRSQKARELKSRLQNDSDELVPDIVVPFVNHVKTLRYIESAQFSIGILGGVGIVNGEIINSFRKVCLNAHPAPLPECRGGGAIQFTLVKDLEPSASVHIATAEIDAGPILSVVPVPISSDETMESLSLKVTIQCALSLAYITKLYIEGGIPDQKPNDGALNKWKDCSRDVQLLAERKLRSRRKAAEASEKRT